MMRVYVRDLVLPVSIGVYDSERAAPQKIRFEVIVEVGDVATGSPDAGKIFSYEAILHAVSAAVAEGHVDLAETLAERIAERILCDPRAGRVTIKVEKLERAEAVLGIELVRTRS